MPACEADALRVEEGLDPNVREIDYAGQRVPYGAATAMYTPFFGGWGGGDGGDFGGGGLGDFGGGGGDFGGGDFGGGGDF